MKVIAALLVAALLTACGTQPPAPPEQPAPVAKEPPPPEIPARPFPPETFEDLLIAEFALRRGAYELALGNYLQQAHASRDIGVTARATRLAQFLRADRAALDAAQLWAELAPDNVDAQYAVASLLARFQRPLDALPHMLKVLELGGNANFAALAASSLQQSESVQQELLNAIDSELQKQPDNLELMTGKALLLQGRDELEPALTLARQVLAQRPDDVHAIIIEARLLQQMDRMDEARNRLEEVVQRHPDNRRLRLQYARLLTRVDMKAAYEQFQILVQQSPEDQPELLLSLALTSREAGMQDEAEQYLNRLLEIGEHTNEAHFYLGQIAEDRGDVDAALAHYRAITPSQEFFAGIGRSTGLILQRDGLASARDYLAQLRTSHPEHAVRLYLFEAEMLMQQNELEAAHKLLTEALALHPKQPNLLYTRSLVSEKRRDVALVEQDLRALLAQDPDNAIALNALGYTLANLTDRLDEAYELISRALAQKPDEPAILDSMGWVEYRRGNLQKALPYLERAYQEFQDAEVAAHLGEVLWQLDQKDRARSIWRKALEQAPDSHILRETVERLTGTPTP